MGTTSTVGEDLAVAAVAGYLGAKAMEPVSQNLYELESEQDRAREDGEDLMQIAVWKVLAIPLHYAKERRADRAREAQHRNSRATASESRTGIDFREPKGE